MRRSTYLASDSVLSLITFKELVWFDVILPELFDNVLADIAVLLFNLARDLQLIFGRYICHLSPFTHEVQHELGDVATCDGDVLDGTSNDVPLSAGNDMSDSIAGINDSARQGPISDSIGRPRRSQSKNSLNSDIETFDIE